MFNVILTVYSDPKQYQQLCTILSIPFLYTRKGFVAVHNVNAYTFPICQCCQGTLCRNKREVTEFVKHLPKGLQKDQTISLELHRVIYKKLNVPPTKPYYTLEERKLSVAAVVTKAMTFEEATQNTGYSYRILDLN